MAENLSHIASAFQSIEDIARIRPSLRLPDLEEDYEILLCRLSNRGSGRRMFYDRDTFYSN